MPAFAESFEKEDAERILGYMQSFSSEPAPAKRTPKPADVDSDELDEEAGEAAPAPGEEE
jgi:hypothetical protein